MTAKAAFKGCTLLESRNVGEIALFVIRTPSGSKASYRIVRDGYGKKYRGDAIIAALSALPRGYEYD